MGITPKGHLLKACPGNDNFTYPLIHRHNYIHILKKENLDSIFIKPNLNSE